MIKIFKKLNKKHNDEGLYRNTYEKQFMKSYVDFFESDKFEDTYKRFVKNMDEQSTLEIARIVNRIKLAYYSDEKRIDMFNEIEKKEMKLSKDMQKDVVKMSDNMFCYKDYFMPFNMFAPDIFYSECHVKGFDYPQRFADKAIMDVGAMIGDSAIILARHTNDKVYSFEPIDTNYKALLATIKMNELEGKIIPENLALSSENGSITISLCSDEVNGGASFDARNGEMRSVVVKTQTLDEYVAKNKIKVGLIKVDIEGAEQEFLKGAMNVIKTQRPSLALSIYHKVEDLFAIKIIVDNLNLGYKFKVKRTYDGLIYNETLLLCEVEKQ